ncbi:MAG: hypothetical protein ACK5JF_01855 [Oscillospiraceae bacterium]
MTDKYFYVRRECWENQPEKIIENKRTLAQIIKVYRWPMWVLLVAYIVSAVILIVVIWLLPSLWYVIFIPYAIAGAMSILNENVREKDWYKTEAREEEWNTVLKNYDKYILVLREILRMYDVDSKEKIEKLKEECKT